MRLITAVLSAILICSPAPLLAADEADTEIETIVIPLGKKDDQFDKEFADDFASEFDDDFGDTFDDDGPASEELIADPLEGFNCSMFYFNDRLYFYVMKPVARGYRFLVPSQARVSVANAFANLTTPIRAGNSLLQLKFRDVGVELYRFLVNSTVGLGGLFDPAASLAGVKKVDDEDFGQTMGVYGIGHGFYLVLPVLGPSSLRDAIGSLADTSVYPLRYADLTYLEYLGVKSYKVINALSLDPDTYEGIVRDALDPYLFIRAAYAQRRLAQVGKTKYNLNVFDDFKSEQLQKLNPFKWLGQ